METKIAAFTFFSFLFFIVSAARMAVDPSLTNPSATAGTEEHQSADSNILLPGDKPNSDLDSNNHNHNHNHLPDESEKTTDDLNPRANFSRFHPINRHFHGKVTPRVQKPIGKQRRTCHHSHKLPSHKNPRTKISGENDDVVPDRMNIHDHPDVVPYRMNIHHHPKSSDNVVPNRMNIHNHQEANDDVVPNRMNNIHDHPEASDDVVVPNRMNNIHDHPKASDDDVVVPNRMNNIHNYPKAPRGDQIQSNWFKVTNHYGPRRHHTNNRNNNMMMMNNRRPMFDREKLKNAVRQQKQKKREEEAGFMKSIRKFLKHTFD